MSADEKIFKFVNKVTNIVSIDVILKSIIYFLDIFLYTWLLLTSKIFAEVPLRKISGFYYTQDIQLFWHEGTEETAPYVF